MTEPAGALGALEACARPTVGPRGWSAYRAMGVAGYAAAVAIVLALAIRADLGLVACAVLALVPPLTFAATTRIVARLVGAPRVVFYQNAIAVVAASAIALRLVGADVVRGLDLAVIGLGVFLALGRLGCFRVACCHGRPARWGVRYGAAHAGMGLGERVVGHPLLPVQLVDGLLSAALAAGAIAIELGPHRPGAPLVLYAAGYAAGRFVLELARGDSARPYLAGASEAQWTAAGSAALVAAWRPTAATLGIAAALSGAVGLLAVARRRGWFPRLWLLAPRHLDELDRLARSGAQQGGLDLAVTSEGLRLSMIPLPGRPDTYDWVVSLPDRDLGPPLVRAIVARLGRRWVVDDVFAARTPGLVHVVARWTRGPAAA